MKNDFLEKLYSQESVPLGQGRTYIPQKWYRAVPAGTDYLALLLEIKNRHYCREKKGEFLSRSITVRLK